MVWGFIMDEHDLPLKDFQHICNQQHPRNVVLMQLLFLTATSNVLNIYGPLGFTVHWGLLGFIEKKNFFQNFHKQIPGRSRTWVYRRRRSIFL